MTQTPLAGPLEVLELGDGTTAPFYVVPFDKAGVPTGPRTLRHLIAAAESGEFSDLFLFSHGWNNDWPTSLARYRAFFSQFQRLRQQATMARPYRPLLVGIFWPSTALVFGEEKGPRFASPEASDEATGERLAEIDQIAALLEPSRRAAFYDLATADRLPPADALELARLVLPLLQDTEDPSADASDLTAEDLLEIWRTVPGATEEPEEEDDEGFGMAGEDASLREGPAAAGLFSFLDPRKPLRMFTVWKMKDRAGRVGSAGVADLLRQLLSAAPAMASHLIGHSYGCKVVLSAIVGRQALPRNAVSSLLLLQPAINFWAFAENVAGEGFAGGYRDALRVVRQPILSTLSKHDFALRRSFHLAVTRRKKDLGEVRIAAIGGPERYGALGGWGPRGCPPAECETIPMPAEGEPYPSLRAGSPQIFALEGSELIAGHGDITTPHTAWALLQQVLSP
ncbi:MAG: hypothetical protein AAF604_00845 [Acidobacteriota bacterium]